uniref:Uncharacterized protein n=1 Tax=viral metagenome TaxID=1070528 RepID=A0A6M3XRQ2_9ZZZZ
MNPHQESPIQRDGFFSLQPGSVLLVEPLGWPCSYEECPPGLFIFRDTLCLMSEYGGDSYLASSGEAFWGGVSGKEARDALVVQPCVAKWGEANS